MAASAAEYKPDFVGGGSSIIPDKRTLHPATAAELEESLSIALRYAGKKRVHTADDVMARVTAERLVQHLDRSGYVLMRRPAASAPSTSGHRHPNSD